MSAVPLIVVGGGEHALVVIDAALSRPGEWALLGYSALSASVEITERFGLAWLGDDAQAVANAPAEARFVLGIGALKPSPLRRDIAARLDADHARWATVAHARAVVAPTAALLPGVVVLAGAVVNTGASVGAHAIVNTGAIVEHDVAVGAFAVIGPGAILGGGASVGDGAFVGLGSRVRDHVAVGAGATVGMGAVVVRAVGADEVVVGVPARRVQR